jgi:hypothetical protein
MEDWEAADAHINASLDNEIEIEEGIPTSAEAYSDYETIPLQAHEIRELSNRGGKGSNKFYYTEGDSGPLWAGLIPPDERGYAWFCFEGLWVDMAMELQRLGFTATQIMEARSRG